MAETLVVKSKVKEVASKKGLRFSAEAYDVLSSRVETLLTDAAARAKANGRKTIKASDC